MTDDTSSPDLVWRWPPPKAMSPSSLKTFGQCHFRIKLRYVQNIPPPDQWVQFYALGNATHSALGTIAQQMKIGVPPIGEAQIRLLCGMHMPLSQYPTPEAHEADVKNVLEWVRRGRSWLERQRIDDWLLIEQMQKRKVPLLPTRATYELLAKPDLVLRRTDADGQAFIHIIDWKTGGVWPEDDVPVIHRYVLRQRLQEWMGDASLSKVRFTWIWLKEQDHKDVDVSVEHCNDLWPGIVEQMEAMATETEWKATPGWHCRYCPYSGNHCPEKAPIDDDY